MYGVYADAARVSWSPTKIFVDEIKYVQNPSTPCHSINFVTVVIRPYMQY